MEAAEAQRIEQERNDNDNDDQDTLQFVYFALRPQNAKLSIGDISSSVDVIKWPEISYNHCTGVITSLDKENYVPVPRSPSHIQCSG